MPESASITTSSARAITLTQGCWGAVIVNESDTDIFVRKSDTAAISGEDQGITIAASGGQYLMAFTKSLTGPLDLFAIHAGTGSKTLTYELLTVAHNSID